MVCVERDHLIPAPSAISKDNFHYPRLLQAQPALERFQELGSLSFSEQPVAVPQNPHSKECLPNI